ncbi:MAG: 16S rRNA (guanine(527)-N(7))-methyltransferase RsmG [Imperialibacter sp.]|uniref:16S rRNA (guanine(527)-N(7))-methyltransferase RsmG n=1 Tax=Imperialibacter sp. TaxID=2038411 RepID=UPI0032EBB2DC
MSPKLIFQYFPNLTATQKKQFSTLYPLYEDWNSKINVVSRKDIEQLYLHHVLHSLAIAKLVSFQPGTEVLDVGTGGGFPGIPLAILFPDAEFTLVDSIGKKILVVKEVCKGAGIQNVTAIQGRAEEQKGEWDFVVSRAVTRLKPFIEWVENKISKTPKHSVPNGILCLKGGDLDEELSEIDYPHHVHDLSDFFKEEFFETKKLVMVSI